MKKILLLCFSVIAVVFLHTIFRYSPSLSPLYISGNQILSRETGEAVRLQGIVSDYFRFEFNNDYPAASGGLEAELKRISILKRAGAPINLVGLYLAGFTKLREHIDELDRYIAFARENDIYVFLAPAGIGFWETNPEHQIIKNEAYWQSTGQEDLTHLTEFLSSRYGHEPHVLYQLTAEPTMPYQDWLALEARLAGIVRKHSENPIIVSTPFYTPYFKPWPVLSFDNLIYSTGGYIRKRDGAQTERKPTELLGDPELQKTYPTLAAEFGGHYGGDFSSADDLASFKEILALMHQENASYSVYRLSSAFAHDGLALFDTHNNLTKKGRVFIESFLK